MQLRGADETEQTLDFSSPIAIVTFVKKTYAKLAVLDKAENCTVDEDKRSLIFRDKIF